VSISKQTATVYYSQSKRRRYFTLKAAVQAEAKAMIFAKFPNEDCDYDGNGACTYGGYHFPTDDPERYEKLLNRLCRIIARQYRNATVTEAKRGLPCPVCNGEGE
jgi:hypothetical protein